MALYWVDLSDEFEIDVSKLLEGNPPGNKAVLTLAVAPAGIFGELRVNKKEYHLGLLNFYYTRRELEEINAAGMAYALAKTEEEHKQAHILAHKAIYKTVARIIGVEVKGDIVNLSVITQDRTEGYGYGAKIYSAESLAVAA